jgi:hypothetical protein
MTGGEIIRAVLTGGSPAPTDAGDKVRQDAADQQDEVPYIIFRRVEVFRDRGIDGTLMAVRERFVIECWGAERSDSDMLEAQATAALQAATYYPEDNEVDGIDPEVKVMAAVFAVDVWTTPAVNSVETIQA